MIILAFSVLSKNFLTEQIPKHTRDGKLDFAALRNSYVTLAAEAGANAKELQTLARHSTPNLTMNVYVKKPDGRLSELAEKVGESLAFLRKSVLTPFTYEKLKVKQQNPYATSKFF